MLEQEKTTTKGKQALESLFYFLSNYFLNAEGTFVTKEGDCVRHFAPLRWHFTHLNTRFISHIAPGL